ncbi:tripartite tricarboxylate transporter TctB family protein [Paracoccus sp. (in: a-proteobacteria)]|uniref:tripartite tricarboxylate transporter TctB family protein n=1 Tax=Paracoccus sp. TaxID=267 RepID=UPI003A86A243
MRYITDRLGDIVAGLVTGGIGLFIIVEARRYDMGSLHSMGPGYFPVMLGTIMLVLALFMLATAQPGDARLAPEKGQLRGIAFLTAAFGAFALTIESRGIVVAVSLAVFLSALANRRTPVLAALVLALATAAISALIFRVGLGLQMKAF